MNASVCAPVRAVRRGRKQCHGGSKSEVAAATVAGRQVAVAARGHCLASRRAGRSRTPAGVRAAGKSWCLATRSSPLPETGATFRSLFTLQRPDRVEGPVWHRSCLHLGNRRDAYLNYRKAHRTGERICQTAAASAIVDSGSSMSADSRDRGCDRIGPASAIYPPLATVIAGV